MHILFSLIFVGCDNKWSALREQQPLKCGVPYPVFLSKIMTTFFPEDFTDKL